MKTAIPLILAILIGLLVGYNIGIRKTDDACAAKDITINNLRDALVEKDQEVRWTRLERNDFASALGDVLDYLQPTVDTTTKAAIDSILAARWGTKYAE